MITVPFPAFSTARESEDRISVILPPIEARARNKRKTGKCRAIWRVWAASRKAAFHPEAGRGTIGGKVGRPRAGRRAAWQRRATWGVKTVSSRNTARQIRNQKG